jgi:hypothetical protein
LASASFGPNSKALVSSKAVTRNGTPQRKQLSDQLDRLDGIIDCLADGLSEGVRDAVKEGTATAIQQILLEVVNTTSSQTLSRATSSAAGIRS